MKKAKKLSDKNKLLIAFTLLGSVTIIVVALLIKKNISSASVPRKVLAEKAKHARLDPSLEALNFKEILARSDCKNVNGLCEDIGLVGRKEGTVIEDGKIFVFVNLEDFPLQKTHLAFQRLPEQEKQELILAEVATHPDLLDQLEDFGVKDVVVVGFKSLDDIVTVESVMTVVEEKVPVLKYETHEGLFAEAFFSGKTGLYHRFLQDSVEFHRM